MSKHIVMIDQVSEYISDTMKNLESVRGQRITQIVQFLSTALSVEVCLKELEEAAPDGFHKDMAAIAMSGLHILVNTMMAAVGVTPAESEEAAAEIKRMQEATKREMKRSGM